MDGAGVLLEAVFDVELLLVEALPMALEPELAEFDAELLVVEARPMALDPELAGRGGRGPAPVRVDGGLELGEGVVLEEGAVLVGLPN